MRGFVVPPQRTVNRSGAQAATETFDYYISTTGSDSNPGTLGSPWAITALNTKGGTYGGKRVGVLDGTYGQITISGQPASGNFSINWLTITGGSVGVPTVIKSVNRWGAIIDGQRTSMTNDPQSGLMGGDGNYWTIDGFEFKGGNYQHVHSHSGTGHTVQNCWLHDQHYTTAPSPPGANSACIFFNNNTNATIRNNYLEDFGASSDGNRHDCILAYSAGGGISSGWIVEYNTVTNLVDGGNCFFPKEATAGNKNHTVRWNYFDGHTQSGVGTNYCILWWGQGTASGDEDKIYGNVLWPIPGRALLYTPVSHAGKWSIYNNTFVGDWGDDGGMVNLQAGSPNQYNIYNNIFSRTARGFDGDMHLSGTGAIGTMDYNLYDSSPALSVNLGGTTYTTLGALQAATSKDTNSSTSTDPLFTGTGSGAEIYQLQAGSAAKTLGAGGTEIGAWNSGQDANGIGYSASRT